MGLTYSQLGVLCYNEKYSSEESVRRCLSSGLFKKDADSLSMDTHLIDPPSPPFVLLLVAPPNPLALGGLVPALRPPPYAS